MLKANLIKIIIVLFCIKIWNIISDELFKKWFITSCDLWMVMADGTVVTLKTRKPQVVDILVIRERYLHCSGDRQNWHKNNRNTNITISLSAVWGQGTEEMHSGIPWYLYKVNSKVKISLSLIFLITTGIVQHNDSMLSWICPRQRRLKIALTIKPADFAELVT